ncbi:MAG: hypothetical protein QOJ02_3647 [Acidobacteriota bacterium]|jgi:hypothetical protein|nr:hypothetical protein [Acidobacteriota bacterium]
MSYIFRTIKKLFFWGYARNTWQYDVLCALILAFIFLTPQSWFSSGSGMKNWSNGEPAGVAGHQNPVASKIILPVGGNFPARMAQNEIENRVRALTGRTDTEVINVEPRLDASGKIVAYEVDIR